MKKRTCDICGRELPIEAHADIYQVRLGRVELRILVSLADCDGAATSPYSGDTCLECVKKVVNKGKWNQKAV